MLLNFNAQLLCLDFFSPCLLFPFCLYPRQLSFYSLFPDAVDIQCCGYNYHTNYKLVFTNQVEVLFASRSSRPIRISIKLGKGLPFSRVTVPKWKNTQHPIAHMWNLLSNPSVSLLW